MTDEVGFGEKTSQSKNAPNDKELEEAKEVLETAAEEPDILNEWEQEFVTSSLAQMAKYGTDWNLSTARKEAIERIKAKLTKEGLL